MRILEEVPSELDKECSRTLSAEHQLLLISLRNILLSIIDTSARTFCSTFNRCSDLSEDLLFSYLASNETADRNNSGYIITLTSQLVTSAACLQALSVWGSTNSVSSSHLDPANANNNTHESPEKQNLNSGLNACPTGLTGIYYTTLNSPHNSVGNISYFDIIYRQARDALNLLKKIIRSLHKKKEKEIAAGFALGYEQRIELKKTEGYENVISISNRLQELVILSCSIMSEWLLIPSLPSSTSITALVTPHAVQHSTLVRAMYSISIFVIEAWDVVLLCSNKNRGLLQWQQQLHEYTNSNSQIQSPFQGPGQDPYSRASPLDFKYSYSSGVTSRVEGFMDPVPFITALIELTVVFTEKHVVRTVRDLYHP